ncbi:MAG: TetR/AcrR family transcriptional regulator [Candidatus Lokiarchaeota archaeon]|nr:TetR/AcrR family transcriptional regulator [Candidatus Lokiarchaeota archaeon]
MGNQKIVKTKIKQTRSRSPEKKAKQFERILDAGKQLFQQKGREGFSLRGLAKMLNMNQNNVYNYVESKRELWVCIRKKFYEQYRNENKVVIKNHEGSTVDLLLDLFDHFFKFAEEDYGAFTMMHIIPSPPSDKIGPFEKQYKPFNFLDGTTRVIKEAINEGEIKENNAALLSFFMFSLILGATIVENTMRSFEENINYKGTEADEKIQFGTQPFTSKEFRKYVLRKIQLGLTDPNLIVDESDYK